MDLISSFLPLIFVTAHQPAAVESEINPYVLVKETASPATGTTTGLPTFEMLREDFPDAEEEPTFTLRNLTMDQIERYKKNALRYSFHYASSLGTYVKTAAKYFKAGVENDYSQIHGTVALLCTTGFKFAPKKLKEKLGKVF
uniref:Uncharacterized protein n=1 Tax=Romanomermis culicivorax TaxID=13658 RepID=A0A915K729_ROMCU